MEYSGVIIIGGGAAGLAAALSLATAGRAVTIIEARDRLGGRVHTVASKVGNLPVELGAEFIHGDENETWQLVRTAGLVTHEVPNRHWRRNNGEMKEAEFWNAMDGVLERLKQCSFDETFQSFLENHADLDERARKLAREYVEGFHAADASRIGVRAITRAEEASAQTNGVRQFRVSTGYSSLIEWLRDELKRREVPVHCGTAVKRVTWEPGRVDIVAESAEGTRAFQCAAALVTLPLGVLQKQCAGSVTFDPPLVEKQETIDSLAMGRVAKVSLHFSSRFWPVENFGFVHSEAPQFPTWWSDERGNILTAWAGGQQAAPLLENGNEAVLAASLQSVSDLFGKNLDEVQKLLLGAYTYDWSQDPFSCGAYSYTPAGMIEMPEILAAPLAGTLFFAGEATDWHGHQGTVHGAIASGYRAAGEILETV